ncbi:large ribosomal subunit protein uL2mz, N-terminal part [Daucus carota subsp. sativus]|uniref:large ribosomal subunit protein uL2mz, N-terminal part n=1 Tax=Daucus carota subsp. sativus TaxID=79200 RepID=UPI0007EF7DC8|nr:PREDICTED: 60S ribosomal protein L2, mitochondrial [Daucus carota subsp. sativus]
MATALFLRSMRLQHLKPSLLASSAQDGLKMFQGARQMASKANVRAKQEKGRRKLENDRNKTNSNVLATGMNLGEYRRQFTRSKGKSAGRNSAGHITIWHRGGGAKRLQRKIDMKRNTSATGIVEKIDYDPNRSSRVALVRWTDGVQLSHRRKCEPIGGFTPPQEIVEPTTTAIHGSFSFSMLPDQVNVASSTPALTTANNAGGGKLTCEKDVFLSAYYPKAKGVNSALALRKSLGFPRMAVAGAKPAFYSLRAKEEVGENTFSLSDIQKWNPQSVVWAHRLKRKAAISWQSLK